MEKPAILGGKPTKINPFPGWPQYDQNEEKSLMEVLHSGVWWRTPGTKTLQFEQDFAKYHQVAHGVACTNGTAAIEIAVAALGIGPGDEVIVPDFTFVATASAVLANGAMPVMVDVDPKTFNIDPDLAEKAITPRTRAIIAVHLGGMPCDMDRLLEIVKKHKLFLIEDSAHAHGSEWKGQKAGSMGDCGTFSFQASKLMTAGEGGIVITKNADLEVRIRSIHDCGRMPGEWFYSHFNNGSNYRLSEWQGAVLSQQLNRLDEQAAQREKNSVILNRELAKIEGIRPQERDARVTRNGNYCYIFHYDPKAFNGLTTEKFIEALNAEGIPTQASYPPVRKLAVFQTGEYRKKLTPDQAKDKHDFLNTDCPVTDDAYENTVWLVHRTLLGTEQDTAEIVEAVKKIQLNAKELTK
jgi:dTDP-4-amino-4,6-dideoxygalactose transaminase